MKYSDGIQGKTSRTVLDAKEDLIEAWSKGERVLVGKGQIVWHVINIQGDLAKLIRSGTNGEARRDRLTVHISRLKKLS